MATQKLTRFRLRLLGFLPLTFFVAQAIHYWHINELGNMLWMCNIGNLVLAIGLFLEKPLLVRVAAIWMIPGMIVWSIYVVPTWGMLFSDFSWGALFSVAASTLAHLGGIAIGLVALSRIRMERGVWIYVFGWYFIVQLFSRLLTPANLNVNLAHRIQSGFESSFGVYWKFWLVLTTMVGIVSWLLVAALHRFWPKAGRPISSENG